MRAADRARASHRRTGLCLAKKSVSFNKCERINRKSNCGFSTGYLMALGKIFKQTGVNASERKLGKLSDKAFLSLWSFQNIYKYKGGKEIADLIVVFENDLIIISDKFVSFTEKVNLSVAWPRWYRAAVLKSVRQVHGAERWIRENPGKVFLDAKGEHPFPFNLDLEKYRIHRIAIARGAEKASKKHFGEGEGLVINSRIKGDDAVLKAHAFQLGIPMPNMPFVHIFDGVAIESLLQENDTAADALKYLSERERFLSQRCSIISHSELDIWASYIRMDRYLPIIEDRELFIIQNNSYFDLARDRSYLLRKLEDKKSYAIDQIIEHFCGYLISGDVQNKDDDFESHEAALRELARTNRYQRRLLAEGILAFDRKTSSVKLSYKMMILPSIEPNFPKRKFAMLVACVPNAENLPPDEYRSFRRNALGSLATQAKLKYTDIDRIVCLTYTPGDATFHSEDLMGVSFEGVDINDIGVRNPEFFPSQTQLSLTSEWEDGRPVGEVPMSRHDRRRLTAGVRKFSKKSRQWKGLP